MPKYRSTEYVLKRRGSAYQVSFTYTANGVRKRFRKSEPTEELARRAAEVAIDRHDVGAQPVAPKPEEFATPTLQRVYDLVKASRWKGSKGERTAVRNAEDCLTILGANTPVNKVGTTDVDRLITELKDAGKSAGTIRRKLAALSTILKYAAERHFIQTLPLIDRKSAGKERKRVRYIRQDEESTGLEYLKLIGKNHEFFAFLIDTGLRLSEAVTLVTNAIRKDKDGTPEAVELLDQEMIKNGEFRIIPCTDRVRSILKGRLDKLPEGERRVWWDMTCDRAEWEWRLMREHLKLEEDRDFVIHACRHTFASRLVQAGVELNVVKALGGWRDLAMVLRYAHQNQAAAVEAINRMQQQSRLKIG